MAQRLGKSHQHSIRHRAEIEASGICGCFYCLRTFAPAAIRNWIDQDAHGIGQTAICPHCGVDSVIGSESGYPIEREFLAKMKKSDFGE